MQLKEVSVDYIDELLELELKKSSILYYYNLISQDKTFYIACQLFLFDFMYKIGLKQIDANVFVGIILQKL